MLSEFATGADIELKTPPSAYGIFTSIGYGLFKRVFSLTRQGKAREMSSSMPKQQLTGRGKGSDGVQTTDDGA